MALNDHGALAPNKAKYGLSTVLRPTASKMKKEWPQRKPHFALDRVEIIHLSPNDQKTEKKRALDPQIPHLFRHESARQRKGQKVKS